MILSMLLILFVLDDYFYEPLKCAMIQSSFTLSSLFSQASIYALHQSALDSRTSRKDYRVEYVTKQSLIY